MSGFVSKAGSRLRQIAEKQNPDRGRGPADIAFDFAAGAPAGFKGVGGKYDPKVDEAFAPAQARAADPKSVKVR